MELKVTPRGTHCWLCGFGPIPAGAAVCPCDICQSNYRRTGSYQPSEKPEVWKPEEKR